MCLGCDTGVKREARTMTRLWSPEVGSAIGQRLQREYLASLLRTDRNTVSYGAAEQVMDGGLIFFTTGRRSKPGTFDIALQQTLAFQVMGNTPRNGMGELGEFIAGRRLDPAKPCTGSTGAVDVNTIQKQHVKVNVEVHRPAESLDQGDGAGLCRGFGIAGFPSQMRSDSAVDDAQCTLPMTAG